MDAIFACRDEFAQLTGPVHVIGNGGTKLQSLALAEVLRCARPDAFSEGSNGLLFYNESDRCLLRAYGPQLKLNRQQRYERHRLGIADVVALNRKRLHHPGVLLFERRADGQEFICLEPVDPALLWYGKDIERTLEAHAKHYERPKRMKPLEEWPLPEVSEVKRNRRTGPDYYKIVPRLNAQGLAIRAHQLDQLVGTIRRLLAEARRDIIRQEAEASGDYAPVEPLGAPFERAVQARFMRWLRESPARAIVQEVRANVKIESQMRPGIVESELDLLIMLRNGILLAIDAKAGDIDENKDLDARLLNLQASTSQLAQMAICAPLYTMCFAEPWFKLQHEVRERVLTVGRMRFLPFTFEGQPESYIWPPDALNEPQPDAPKTIAVPSFEAALSGWIGRYAPV
ncbi:MAG: hypothetical protein RMK02_08040 [Burkholderiales bacterium]|nr:hypothetical protein [Burkholderiales bacterium]